VRHLPVSIAPEAHAQWQWRQWSLSLIGQLMPARFSPANRQRRRRSLIGQLMPARHSPANRLRRRRSLIGQLMPARYSPANRQRRRRSLIGQLKMPARHSPANRRHLLSGSSSGGGDAPRWSLCSCSRCWPNSTQPSCTEYTYGKETGRVKRSRRSRPAAWADIPRFDTRMAGDNARGYDRVVVPSSMGSNSHRHPGISREAGDNSEIWG